MSPASLQYTSISLDGDPSYRHDYLLGLFATLPGAKNRYAWRSRKIFHSVGVVESSQGYSLTSFPVFNDPMPFAFSSSLAFTATSIHQGLRLESQVEIYDVLLPVPRIISGITWHSCLRFAATHPSTTAPLPATHLDNKIPVFLFVKRTHQHPTKSKTRPSQLTPRNNHALQ